MIGATYRLQFRTGVGFDEAAAIVPHLKRAGITHLYASPIFAAVEGSTHGYDVTDHNALDPTLGGAEGFERLAESLAANDLALLLDIVPNHMASSTENPWWRDVLTHGKASRYARHFDIDWSAPKLILPFLGKPYGAAIADGDIVRGEHPGFGPALLANGVPFPLRPGTELIEDPHACHEAQAYRLAHWRLGRDGLTYRRFFEITGLVGVRVEDPAVFDDVHRLVGRLVAEGKVDAVRVDHIDGLADPAGYAHRLREALNVPILVEKILEPGERLPGWDVDGTTGYEFIAAMASLFVDPDGLASLSEHYREIGEDDALELTRIAKHEIINRNLAGELLGLTDLCLALFAADPMRRDHGPFTVREGLAALLAGMPVYRTYVTTSASASDKAVLARAAVEAKKDPLENPAVVDDIAALLTDPPDDPLAQAFIVRVQQTSGPLMAKALEDTVFFRHHRFVGLNEVGGTSEPSFGAELFLEIANTPGLAATQTHDTKRGEDARARLYALADPAATMIFESLWQKLPGDIPARLKWAFAQMLFASEPLGDDPDFARRFGETALKTVREAKEETSWTAQDEAFEAAIVSAAEEMTSRTGLLAPLVDVKRAGAVIGLGQVLLKLIGRPAPDIYQGTFDWDFSMVDPDNRRPVDFAAEAALNLRALEMPADSLVEGWTGGEIKARIMLEGLALRRQRPGLFAAGQVREIPVAGIASRDAVRAFLIEDGRDAVLAAVVLRPLPYLGESGLALRLPAPAEISAGSRLTARITGLPLAAEAADLAPHLAAFPVVLAASWTDSAADPV